MLKEQLHEVQKKIEEACRRSGRDSREVTLIAVSKTKPTSMIEELLPEGIRDFEKTSLRNYGTNTRFFPKICAGT